MSPTPGTAYEPIVDGDVTIAVLYRVVDADGSITRSAPYIKANALGWQTNTDQQVRIPTLRHSLPGCTIQIELYLGQVDLQLFKIYANDPTVDYIDVYPNREAAPLTGTVYGTLEQARDVVGIGEVLYTTGGALANMPPPLARALYTWRNRVHIAQGNTIYCSQEFAPGYGLQFADTMRTEWLDGSGEILALAHIDWNYMVAFKKDAIGILSGPGPDGLGHGNYIVQTLSTKAACANVRSIVNGADGCYYQDSQTGRLMCLTGNLQTRECAPGAFDFSAYKITSAMHVESERQVWFSAVNNAGTDDVIIVLDYKHKTDDSPFGFVYVWNVTELGHVADMDITHGVPMLAMSNGEIAEVVAGQFYDMESDGATKHAILQSGKSGDISPFGLQRMMNVSRVQVLGDFISAHTLTLKVYPQYSASPSTATATVSAAPEQVVTRPPNCMRVQSVAIEFQEGMVTVDDVPVYGGGFDLVGFALEVQDSAKIQHLGVGRIV